MTINLDLESSPGDDGQPDDPGLVTCTCGETFSVEDGAHFQTASPETGPHYHPSPFPT